MMDQLFTELIGKPQLNPAKIITIIAENHLLIDDQAKFLKATLAIPAIKQLPLENDSKRLIQIGPLHVELESQLNKDGNWIINKYDGQNAADGQSNLCDKIAGDINSTSNSRSLIYINDASKFVLSTHSNRNEQKRFLKMVHGWKTCHKHFVVVLYQQSRPATNEIFLRDLEYISDACVRNRTYKNCYMQSIWFQPMPRQKTMLPSRVETHYYTCKIGKSYWSDHLLCFYERQNVTKNYDPDVSDIKSAAKIIENQKLGQAEQEEAPEKVLERLALDEEDENNVAATSTLPYLRAQNPEQSRIFYYPDKDDDIDEDDPDNDLNF